jgi:arginase
MNKTKSVDIIGVPIDLGVKELGLKLGPDALREAKLVEVCRHSGIDVRDLSNIEIPATQTADNDYHICGITQCCNNLAKMVGESVEAGRIPICLGGDHSLVIGSIGGVVSKLGRVGCVWMDAHPDANTPQTSPSGNIHGMPVAVILGHGVEELVNVGTSGATLGYENLILLGIRDIDEGEVEFINRHNIQMFSVFDVLEQGLPCVVDEMIGRLCKQSRNVHVSLDLDVLKEEVAPGVGLPSRCGFDMREATYICRRLASECNITSIDIVGLNPVRDKDMSTAHRAIEIIMELLGYSFSYNYYVYLENQT